MIVISLLLNFSCEQATDKHKMRDKNKEKGKDKSKQKEEDQNKDKDNSSNQDHLSIQVSSSSNRLEVASKKRKDITPNAYGSMTDADETGLTQSPKGQKSSRFVCYDEKEDEDEENEVNENEGGGEGGVEKGKRKGRGKGKGRDRLFRNDDFNNISIEGDPDLDVEGMWREVGGEIGGEKEKVKRRDDIVVGVKGEGEGGGGEEMNGEEEIGMFKERNSDIGTIKQIERLLRRQSDSKERERGGDERSGYGDFSGEVDSDCSNDTTTSSSSCPSPSPSPSYSSSSSSSPGSMNSAEYSNHGNNSSNCSSSDGDIDALVIKEQEISKMIKLSQSVRHATSYCVMHSFVHTCTHHLLCFSLVINCFSHLSI